MEKMVFSYVLSFAQEDRKPSVCRMLPALVSTRARCDYSIYRPIMRLPCGDFASSCRPFCSVLLWYQSQFVMDGQGLRGKQYTRHDNAALDNVESEDGWGVNVARDTRCVLTLCADVGRNLTYHKARRGTSRGW